MQTTRQLEQKKKILNLGIIYTKAVWKPSKFICYFVGKK